MRPATRLFFSLGRLCGGAASLFHGCAASTLTRAELKSGIRTYWQSHDNREADASDPLQPWESDLVERWIPSGASVLVSGCGSGRELLHLVSRGCRVTGLDPAANAVEIARRLIRARDPSAEVIHGFIEDVRLTSAFDVIWLAGHSYCFVAGSETRSEALRRLAERLRPGGRVLVSYQRLPRPRPGANAIARVFGALSRADWRLEAGDYVAWKRCQGVPYYTYTHAFVPEEIAREAKEAGLSIVDERIGTDTAVFVLALG